MSRKEALDSWTLYSSISRVVNVYLVDGQLI